MCGSDTATVIGKRSQFKNLEYYAPFVQSLEPYDRDIVLCGTCGFAHIDPMYNSTDLSLLYGSYDVFVGAHNGRSFTPHEASIWLEQFRTLGVSDWAVEFMKRHGRRPRMLDAGCGYGRTMYLFDRMHFEVSGIDLNPEAIRHVKSSFGFPIEECDLADFDPPEKYDLITLSHVIEHVIDLPATIQKVVSLLSPDGLLFIETPWAEDVGDYVNRYCDIYHTLFFNHLSLYLLGARHGLSILNAQRICFIGGARSKYLQILYSGFGQAETQDLPPAFVTSLAATFNRLEQECSDSIDQGWQLTALVERLGMSAG